MKKIKGLLLYVLVFLLPQLLAAQKNIEVFQEKVNLSAGSHMAYMVEIPQADLEKVKKDWIKLIRQNTKSKVTETAMEMNIQGTLINQIYDHPINIYSTLIGKDSLIKLIAAFEIDSVFFEHEANNANLQNEKIHSSLMNFTRTFAVNQYRIAVQGELDNEKKKLATLNKEYTDLTKQIESDRKEIKGNEQNIKNSQDAIANYEKENERKLVQINNKKEDKTNLKDDPELHKIASKQLKDLEKEKRSIENNLDAEQKNIIKYQSKIEELNRNIDKNLNLVEDKKIEISGEESIIKQINSKLNGIK